MFLIFALKNFSAKYNEDIVSDSTKGTVIYSGETYESYKDFGFYNFSKIPQLFESKTPTFRLNF